MTTKTFDFNTLIDGLNVSHKVRAVLVEGKPWFVAADVCKVLGIANTSHSLRPLDEDEKGIASINTLGGPQRMSIISEPGLYDLLMRSDKPIAKPFRTWLKREVIPAIRTTGGYMLAGRRFTRVTPRHLPLPATYQEAPRLLALSN